jgi:hypothetical protein
MSSYFGVVKTNEDTPVRALLDPLGQFAECHNVCVLGVMHYNKNVAALDADDRISGNTAFKQAARSIWHVIADASNKHRRLFLPGKGNNLKKGDGTAYGMAFSFVSVVLENGEEYSKIAWEAEAIAMTATEYLRANSAERCGDRLEAAVQFLSDLLASRPLKSVDVENKYMEKGFSQRTIERASKDLSIKRYPIREGGKLVWFWKLPSDEKVSLPNEKKVSLPNDLADLLSPMIHKEKNDDFELVCQVNLERGDEKIEHLKTAIETDTLIDI